MTRFRSAISGRFVRRITARRHPRETVAEAAPSSTFAAELEAAVETLLEGASDTVGDLFLRNLVAVRRPDLKRLERLLRERAR